MEHHIILKTTVSKVIHSVYLRISGISIYRRDGLLKDSVYSHEQLTFQRQGDLKVVDLIEKETEIVTIHLNFRTTYYDPVF